MSNIDHLNTENGTLRRIEDILGYTKAFYENLYTKVSPETIEGFYDHCPKLSNDAHSDLSKPLSIDEIKEALKSCKDSSPGLDGIPYSFYKTFGSTLLPLVMDAWEHTIMTGTLPSSQACSVITLIPKAGKDKNLIKNWRPISISPCDLKIITKALSIKVGKYLEEIISPSQMGYVQGRDINFNNRLLRAALTVCKEKQLDYVITSLDAQKAYDSVDHKYIENTLKAYNFPNEFISCVNMLNSNMIAQVQVNGFISEAFKISRGVKQGDALSCALFILAIDPLIRNIENNDNIPSLEITNGCTAKTLAYADDIAVITHNSDVAINNILAEYLKLTKCSGLTLNADKTEILNLSESNKSVTDATYLSQIRIEHKTEITICGNHLSLNPDKDYEINITGKIVKLENQLNRWKSRNLSINGKMMVVKTFAISQLIFTSQFQMIKTKDMKRIESICYKFIWNGTDRVKRCHIKADKDKGGINGIDVISFFNSIAIRQFIKSNKNSNLAHLNSCHIVKEDIKTIARNMLRKLAMDRLSQCDLTLNEDVDQILRSDLSVYVKPYSKSHELLNILGLTSVSSLTCGDFQRGIANKIRRCLPPKLLIITDARTNITKYDRENNITIGGKHIALEKCSSKALNNAIKEALNKSLPFHPKLKYIEQGALFGDIRVTWNNLWRIKNPTLRAIRLKILHKDIWSNEKRCRLGIANNDKCEICGETETAVHQLFLCKNAKRLWDLFGTCTNQLDINKKQTLSDSDIVCLLEVFNDMVSEIVKSVIFKLLIQIDRSAMISENQVQRTVGYWLNIEIKSINKRIKDNKYYLSRLHGVRNSLLKSRLS